MSFANTPVNGGMKPSHAAHRQQRSASPLRSHDPHAAPRWLRFDIATSIVNERHLAC